MKKKQENKKKQRFITVSYRKIKGIRKDTKTKKFLVEKYVRGKRYGATFESLAEAADWKKNFHPGLNWDRLPMPNKRDGLEKRFSHLGIEIKHPVEIQKNGTLIWVINLKMCLGALCGKTSFQIGEIDL